MCLRLPHHFHIFSVSFVGASLIYRIYESYAYAPANLLEVVEGLLSLFSELSRELHPKATFPIKNIL